MTAIENHRGPAIAIGFDPEGDYCGYNVEIFTYFILEDPKVIAELDKNWLREIAECPKHQSHPDDVLRATLASLSETEKAALRRRVQYAMEKWARS
jgi:hypothetical protein